MGLGCVWTDTAFVICSFDTCVKLLPVSHNFMQKERIIYYENAIYFLYLNYTLFQMLASFFSLLQWFNVSLRNVTPWAGFSILL